MFRNDLSFAIFNFKNNNIIDSSTSKTVHELFITVVLKYSENLEASIEHLKTKNILIAKPRKNYYNYLILNANSLYKLINSFDTKSLSMRPITNDDLTKFNDSLIYIGKGKNDRKHQHLLEGKSLFEGNFSYKTMSSKFQKILDIWKLGNGLVVFQIFSNSDHYLSLCREYAMIKAAGKNLTNINQGSVFGIMKSKWTINEIKNFGEMLLFFALKQCIVERPSPIFSYDINKRIKKPVYEVKKYFIKTNYELNGILDYFLEL